MAKLPFSGPNRLVLLGRPEGKLRRLCHDSGENSQENVNLGRCWIPASASPKSAILPVFTKLIAASLEKSP